MYDDDDFKTRYVGHKKRNEEENKSLEEQKGFIINAPETPQTDFNSYSIKEEFEENDDEVEESVEEDEEINDEIEYEDSAKKSYAGSVEGGSMFFKTKDVAEELGISDQEVRNYSQYFAEFLNINKTASGHRRFTRENIEKLAAILEIKENNHYTIEQTIKALSSEEGEIMSARDDMDRLHKLIELMANRIELSGNEIKKSVKEEVRLALTEQAEHLIESSEQQNIQNNEQIKALQEKNEESNRLIEELQKQNSKILEVLTSISEDQKSKDKMIEELSAQNKELIEEVQKKKKFRFFK